MTAWKISADTGGTFTDCLIERSDGSVRRGKVLSSGCLRTEIKAIADRDRIMVEPLPAPGGLDLIGKPVRINGVDSGRITGVDGRQLKVETLPSSAAQGDILEIDSGWEAPVLAMRLLLADEPDADPWSGSFRLGTTRATNALLENKGAPTALFLTDGFADLLRIRDQKRPDLFARHIIRPDPLYEKAFAIRGRLDAEGRETEPLDLEGLREAGREALEAGCTVAAVCFLHSWRNPAHEAAARAVLQECGFETVRCSSAIRPLIKYLDRAETTLVDATLSPVMDRYLDRVQQALGENPLWIMTSAGGLVSRARFHAVDSLVSGPAGGLLGAVASGRRAALERIIALDMGGTSTDVSRWKANLELRQQINVGDARILTPAMPIETVAAGGGSICSFDGERLLVGPRSAGADPGPAAYGAGGPLTLTDIHLLLGRMDPDGFPIPIRIDLARQALRSVALEAGESDWLALAEGFLTIATERMGQAIRHVTLREGEDPAGYGLVAFGGAGGLHACRLAGLLGMSKVVFPPDAGILSARGIHYAPREAVLEHQLLGSLEAVENHIREAFDGLDREARGRLLADGVARGAMEEPLRTVYIRLAGQETSLPVPWSPSGDLKAGFREQFVAIFGYFPERARLECVKVRLRLLERSEELIEETFPENGPNAVLDREVEGFYGGAPARIPVHIRERLEPGEVLAGPAVVRDPFSTFFVERGWSGVCGTGGSILFTAACASHRDRAAEKLGNVEKTLVLNRLEGLVEEMGDQLQRTALSTNIRERLDFSCALLDAGGRLLVNAPHIPVHLGAMGFCVRECVRGHEPGPGDVLITNHPGAGGSHLPDVTLIRTLFDPSGNRIGYLANRAHHAEWGGRTPGSMPADAASLEEEGVLIEPQWLVRNGQDRLDHIEQRLREGTWPSRAARENRIDLEAQLASLRRGATLYEGLLCDYGPETLRRYLNELYRMGADAVRTVLESGAFRPGSAEALLDDGHRIQVDIRRRGAGIVVDFKDTSAEHPGNLNATPAIVRSAVLYVLRLLVDRPMPLNEGLIDAVRIELPRCFLNPEFHADPAHCPAVVGGNVETSQGIVEALVKALGLMAGSQGTMNNLLFGNNAFGYYETIGGGAGAGPGFPGASGVHVHMTNTAITDPEILEQRFPVVCREFSLRKGSGGSGRHRGGDGLVREIRFREPVSVSLLSQSRSRGPAGSHGGGDGRPGVQWIVRADGRRESVPGIVQIELGPGEGIRIETPGGGGWGSPS